MRKAKAVCIAVAVAFLVTLFSGPDASARPKYLAGFSKKYPEVVKNHGGSNGKLTCAVCHPEKNKKKRNNYGAEFGKGLTKKNETDASKIEAALVKAEKGKSHVDGKTFGDLLGDGGLPGDDKSVN